MSALIYSRGIRLIAIYLYCIISNLTCVLVADDAPALFQIRQNGKFGFINAAGEIAIPPKFSQGEFDGRKHFLGGLQATWIGDRVGYIDVTGKVLIEPRFSSALSFSEGLAAVRSAEGEGKWGYIDKTGGFVIPPRFDGADIFSDGLAQVLVNGRMGYIDKSVCSLP